MDSERGYRHLVKNVNVATALLAASVARASAPLISGPFTYSYSFIGMHCDGYDVLIEGTETDTFTVSRDEAGEITKVIWRARYPRDTLTNTVTGKSIVNPASGLAGRLAELTGAERDRAGRVTVEPDLTLPGHPDVFALGDMVRVRGADGASVVLPGVAPVAMQQGRYVAKVVRGRLGGFRTQPFRYRDKGNLATIGREAAVADIKGLRLSGFIAWSTWLLVHLWYLIGFQNRLLVHIRWAFSFATHGRGARLITEQGTRPRRDSPSSASDLSRPSQYY